MKPLLVFCLSGVALLLAACVAPQLRSAPLPTPQQVAQSREVQSRVIAVPFDSVVPQTIEILFDNGYIVRSADAQLGFVAFFQQWNDPSQAGANLSEEGSILFKAAGAQSTQVRIVLTGGWQRLQVTGGGTRSTDSGMVGAVQQDAGAVEYKKLLDVLEAGLTAGKP